MLRGLFALAVGIVVFVRPLDSVAALALVIAWWALVSGVVDVVHAIDLAPAVRHWWVQLLSGLVGIGFGIAAIVYYPVLSLAFAVVWTAWWLMSVGILGTYGSMMQKAAGLPWGWTLTFGVLSVIAAAFALAAPPITLAALLGLIGALALAAGVTLIAGAITLRGLTRRWKQTLNAA
jgi:uncharacterized membrane protein HdeD (DUF308 family)